MPVPESPVDETFEEGTRRRRVRTERRGARYDVVHRWLVTPDGFAPPALPAPLADVDPDGPFAFRAPEADGDAWRYRDVGALGVFDLLPAASRGSDVLERAFGATGRALRLAHDTPRHADRARGAREVGGSRPVGERTTTRAGGAHDAGRGSDRAVARGRGAAHARLERMRAVAEGTAGPPGLHEAWRAAVGFDRWDRLARDLAALEDAPRRWILGDASVAGLRWRPPAQLVVLVDGHAGPGATALDVGMLLGETLELAVVGADAAPTVATALRRAAAALLDGHGDSDPDHRRLVAAVAAWRPLLHAADWCDFVGEDGELGDAHRYGAIAAAVGTEARALVIGGARRDP